MTENNAFPSNERLAVELKTVIIIYIHVQKADIITEQMHVFARIRSLVL